jgi:ATP-dependent Clp protease ATP-binding subunit ClpA/ATP-dependent Clp protease ATP-binding subunit ClpC
MNLTIAVYQVRGPRGLEWTTLALGPHTRSRSGKSAVKLQRKLVEDLRTIIGELPVRELAYFQLPRGIRLERVRLELDFRRVQSGAETRKLAGLFPLILEPRWRTREEAMTIAYHPLRQDEWFPVDPEIGLEEQAKAFFTRAWAGLSAYDHEALRSNRKDNLQAISFVARPKSLLDELGKKKGPWDDLELEDRPGKKKKRRGGNQVLNSLGTNLTLQAAEGTLDTGMPRSPYREQLQLLLGGERRTPVLLIGPPGCGKRTLLRRFVAEQLEAEDFRSHRNLDKVTEVWSVAGKRIIAGMSYVGDWEQRCLKLLEESRGGRRILFVEDLHAFGRIGRSRDSDSNLALFFQGPLARGELTLVGAMTPEQLQRLETDSPSFAALFTQLHVRPTSTDETLRMLLHESRELESQHAIIWEPTLFPTLLEQAQSLFAGAALPGKALDLLRKLAADYSNHGELDAGVLFEHLSAVTGLPDFLLHPNKKLEPSEVHASLSRKVMGQPQAVEVAADLIARIHAGLTDPRRPYGVYLFTGPTGTGKTELARALATYLYGEASRMVRLDMAEFQTPDAVARLTGDMWQPEGRLTRTIREQPFTLVLLDEIEKAHPALLNLLLQTFDEGRLTDASGETADFTHTVIVMTSNLGARQKQPVGIGQVDARSVALDSDRAVREFFPPELFNRIDRIVHFSPLSRESGEKVVEKELARLLARRGLTSRHIFVSTDDEVKRRIVAESFDAALGARPLKRYLEEKVGHVLSEAIIRGPQALMRLFQLYTRDGRFEVQADALVPREPEPAGFALEPLLSLPIAKLREKALEAREEVQRMRHSDSLGALSEQVRFHLARLQAGERDHAESLYTLDAMRLYLEEFAARLESLARAPEEEAREMIEIERFGVLRRHPDPYSGSDGERVRIFDRRAFEPVRAVTREQMLDAVAEVFFLKRILGDLARSDQHVITLELFPLGQWREGGASGSMLARWLCDAYTRGTRGEIESFAVRFPGGALTTGGPRELQALQQWNTEPVHIVLKQVGPGVRPFFEGEAGLHVWQSTGRLPEIVKVRVHDASAPEPLRLLALHDAKLQAFHKARQEGAHPLPENPEAAAPVVRAYRVEPPTRPGAVAPMELDDYLLSYSGNHRVRAPSEALPTLWRLRMTQNPTDGSA